MAFQVCPICNGHGGKANNLEWEKCSTCNGSKIISSETGLPPAGNMMRHLEVALTTDERPEDIITPLSVLDELSDEEVLYWSTPYFDVLETMKEENRKKQESNVNN